MGVLKELKAKAGEEGARKHWEESQLDLKAWLRDDERDEQHLLEFVDDQDLGWLFPLVPMKKYLQNALTKKLEVEIIVEWLKANVAQELICSSGGARAVMRA